MIRVRFGGYPGQSLTASIERLQDGMWFDFNSQTFTSMSQATTAPAILAAPLTEGTGIFAGRYSLSRPTPLAQWSDGYYCVNIHDGNSCVGVLQAELHGGDDQPPPVLTLPTKATVIWQ